MRRKLKTLHLLFVIQPQYIICSSYGKTFVNQACLFPIMHLPSTGVRLMRKERPAVLSSLHPRLYLSVQFVWTLTEASSSLQAVFQQLQAPRASETWPVVTAAAAATAVVMHPNMLDAFEVWPDLKMVFGEPSDWCFNNLEQNQPVKTQNVALSGVI